MGRILAVELVDFMNHPARKFEFPPEKDLIWIGGRNGSESLHSPFRGRQLCGYFWKIAVKIVNLGGNILKTVRISLELRNTKKFLF